MDNIIKINTRARERLRTAILAINLILVFTAGILFFNPQKHKVHAETLTIDIGTAAKMQKIEGWGTALAWWANMYGGIKTSINGQEHRKNITDMIFTDKGLNLNIARYNLGTVENPANTRWNKVLNMPPFAVYLGNGNYEFDWDNDPRQMWVLREFMRSHEPKGDQIIELWANTAPYWMTSEQTATRPSSNSIDSIPPEQYGPYAKYLVNVMEHFYNDTPSIKFDYISPINEPNSYYGEYMGSDSGIVQRYGSAQSGIINAIYNEQVSRGITGRYKISGTDEIAPTHAYTAWNAYDTNAKNNLAKINTHTYFGINSSAFSNLKNAAYGSTPNYDNPNKNLWVSERTLYMGSNPPAGYWGVQLAQEIIDSLKLLGATAWNHWQATDMLGISENSMDWAYKMEYFSFGNFTKYIVPGSRILNFGDDSTVAALTPDNKIVVVAAHGFKRKTAVGGSYAFTAPFDDENKYELDTVSKKLDLTITGADVHRIQRIRTTASSKSWRVEHLGDDINFISETLPPASVTTYIFDLNEQTSEPEDPGEDPGGEEPGGENPGGEEPGGEEPGGENPGGNNKKNSGCGCSDTNASALIMLLPSAMFAVVRRKFI